MNHIDKWIFCSFVFRTSLFVRSVPASCSTRGATFWITVFPDALIAAIIAATAALYSSVAYSQTSITVQIPESTQTTWSLNGQAYTGSTSSLTAAGQTSNSLVFQGVTPSGTYQATISTVSNEVTPTSENPNPTPSPVVTSMGMTVSGNAIVPPSLAAYQLTSTGGSSSQNPQKGGGFYANVGSNLSLGTSGVGGFVTLGQLGAPSYAFFAQSAGGSGSSQFVGGNGSYFAYGASGGTTSVSIMPVTTPGSTAETAITVSGNPVISQSLPWLIPSAAINASSLGGSGSGWFINSGEVSQPRVAGNGGNGESVNLTVGSEANSDFFVFLGDNQNTLTATTTSPVAGIIATSIGAPGGVCCVQNSTTGAWIPVTLDIPTADIAPFSTFSYGQNGSGGPVNVQFTGGTIQGASDNLYGVIASSVGSSTQIPIAFTSLTGLIPQSGTGGAVTVDLNGSSINLSGSNTVGIFASSTSDQVIIPSQLQVAGTGNSAGAVQVGVSEYSSIFVGNNNPSPTNQLSAGVVAISSTGWLFQPIGNPVQGASTPGNGGDVTVTNAGTITAYGDSAVGIVALSLGNGGILSNAQQSVSNLNYISSANSGSTQSNVGGTVTVNNSNRVITNGNAAIGILAASNGSGGLLANIPDAQFQASSTNKQSILIGSQPSGYVAGAGDSVFAADGGSVSISNSGSVITSGGVAAIGLLAQSVGGGGASFTEGVALFVGDNGGKGGDGGAISLTNSGSISTSSDGSIGLLAQSIGGGGGHGANTAGLFVALGAQGGSGGSGGNITTVLNSGSSFSTTGDFSTGVLLQSVGGGGGNGGFGKAYGVFYSTGIGGVAGGGGGGGLVTVTGSGTSSFASSTTGNQSHGLLLQSIGGGGGTGGHAYSYSAGVVFAGASAVGGSGGGGGAGGDLSLCSSSGSACGSLSGSITTTGYDSMGLLLQTIGGGGGYGGGASAEAYAAGVDPQVPITVSITTAVGGTGATGGAGGNIDVTSGLNVSTQGTGSHAIFAQSVGGGGGAGADSTAGANSYNDTKWTFNASVSVGGSGAGGGNGGQVQASTQATSILSTVGHNASGLFAQSVGGGGGYGGIGNAYQNDVSLQPDEVGLIFALGGGGAAGGTGGAVTVSNASMVSTIGTQSPGVIAQSIGGGGGLAGNAGSQSAGGNYSFNVAVGGAAGGGNSGDSVQLSNSGSITTGIQLDLASNQRNSLNLSQPIALGGDSHGLVAQSIGGGGGIGGNSDPTASLIGSVQTLLNSGAGDYVNATGVGTYFTSTSADAPMNYNGTVSIGGSGGSGGSGGNVTVTNTANITTYGHRSFGILGQSIGAGGGIGGASTASSSLISGSASATILSGFTLGFGVNVGGSSGSGGNGGQVDVNLQGSSPLITTAGYASHAVVAQSIGGGGGIAHEGSVFSATGSVGPTPTISVSPTVKVGSLSAGDAVQGSGGQVSVNATSGIVFTMGDNASGFLLQSIGGGGGIATFGCTNSGNAPPPYSQTNFNVPNAASACFKNTASISIPSLGLTPAAFQQAQGLQPFGVSIRAASGVGNSTAGPIKFNATNQIITQGDRSLGLVAQSIGGGGGFILAPSQTIASASLPTGGMNNSAGGAISLTINAPGAQGSKNLGITTTGAGAWGILAQSIGAGGGFIGDPAFALTSVPVANNTGSELLGGEANGGNIAITLGSSTASVQPAITTNGQYAHAIVAQSIGGGGGIATDGNGNLIIGASAGSNPSNQGSGGTIGINVYGSISTFGSGSLGVFAQSTGTLSSGGAISIAVPGSISVTPTYQTNGVIIPSAAAILISGGSNDASNPNVVTVSGFVGGTDGSAPEDVTAILADYGYTNVVNTGTISGSVNLGSTPGEITNTGTLNTGQSVVVAQNSLHNYGTMSIGGQASVSRTAMQGRLVQYDSGKLIITVDSEKSVKSDFISIDGDTLLGGEVQPRTLSLLPGSLEILEANTLSLNATVRDSLIFDWSFSQLNNALYITPTANFTPSSYPLTSNQASLAHYLERSWNAGEGLNGRLFGFLHAYMPGDEANYQDALTQISGQVLNSQAIQFKTAFATALSDSLTCPTITPEGLKLNETNCAWARISGDISDQAENSSNSGYRSTAGSIRLGARRDIGNRWVTGFSVGYTNNYLTAAGLTSTGSFLNIALSVQKKVDDWSLGGSLAFAQGWLNNNRSIYLNSSRALNNLQGHYDSSSRLSMFGLRLRAAYEIESHGPYVKPYADVDFLYSYQDGYQESGGLLALKASSNSQFNIAITPMIELGTTKSTNSGHVVKAYISAGASFLPSNNVSTQMAFANSSASGDTFGIVTSGPSVLGRLNLGVQVFNSKNLDLRAEYGLQAGTGYWNQSLSASLVYRF